MRKNISIPDQDQDVLDHLRNQDNASQYIIRLVRKDMNRSESRRQEIVSIVEEFCSTRCTKNDSSLELGGDFKAAGEDYINAIEDVLNL